MGEEAGADELGRPKVVVSLSMSVDARITLRRDSRLMEEETGRMWASLWPSRAQSFGKACSSLLHDLYQPQAVLEGSGSLVPDSAGPLTDLSGDVSRPDELYIDFLPQDVVERPGREQWFTVVDSRGRIRWHTKRADGFDALVLVAAATPAAYLAYLRQEHICYLVAGEEKVNLEVALRRMRERLGVTRVVSTAGGGLNGALLRAGLVDELHVLVCPALIGGLGTPTIFDGPSLPEGAPPTRLRLLSSHVDTDGTLGLRYDVPREGAR